MKVKMKKKMKKEWPAAAVAGALLISVIIGWCLQNTPSAADLFAPLGVIYVNLIKMIMVPLVFTSLILGIASTADLKKIGKMGIGTIIIFLFTTAAAVITGLIVSNLFQPGLGIAAGSGVYEVNEFPGIQDILTGIFPSNMIDPLLNADMLQIIFMAVIVGLAFVKVFSKENKGNKEIGKTLYRCIEDLYEIMIVITNGVMSLTPIGILGLMIPAVSQNGLDVLLPLGKMIFVFYLAVVIHIGIVYCVSLQCLSRVSVKEFFLGMLPAQVVAFVTCSSAAALPVSMRRTQEKLKVSKEVSGFVLPLGATVNMDGNALYQGIAALFIAQAYGIELSLWMQLVIVLTGTFASIGAAGIPGAGMVVLSTVLMSVGLPVDGIALIAGIDRILDMGRTLTNVTGDAVAACVIENQMHPAAERRTARNES